MSSWRGQGQLYLYLLLFTVFDIIKQQGVNFPEFLLCAYISEFVYLNGPHWNDK
jgi:hypothetical protein